MGCVVVGGGHNGLAAAAYLAGAGLTVVVLERRHQVGGACTLERPFTDQGCVVSDQMWDRRLATRTPMPGVYLCGAATHPGGGVSAVNGRNAAMAVLADRRRRGKD